MLKVVGASWLQTRISTYILIAVALLGIGVVLFGVFGHVEDDGTYSATVSWNHKGGYHIDFWGQGNDLATIKLNAARAYYKTSISESGWSVIEIETSSKYPDTVQAYAAGLLEGSLTWQLIHHHWYNTVNAVCEKRAEECQNFMQYLRKNAVNVRERANLLGTMDPFWHMVRLFYFQLDGLEAGWKFAVRRSRQTVEMDTNHFLWLAMAVDLPDLGLASNVSGSHADYTKGMIFLKSLPRVGLEPLIAIGHTTAAPYAKMLRLLKKYTFGYHMLPMPKIASSPPVPGRSIVMSSYPGALSSHDEFYLIQGSDRELIVAGTPLAITDQRGPWNFTKAEDQVMTSVKVMVANHLATDGGVWSRTMFEEDGSGRARQWITLEPRNRDVWLVEQLPPGITRVSNISQQFATAGVLCNTGKARLRKIIMAAGENDDNEEDHITRSELVAKLQRNVTTMESFRRLMRGYSYITTTKEDQASQILAYRGDLEEDGCTAPFGVIDAKIVLADADGVISFEGTSGPSALGSREAFRWSKAFPNASHIGQPDLFNFESVAPLWVWD